MNLTHVGFSINKVEKNPDGSLFVYGKATDETLDSDLQIIDLEFAKQAAADWFKTGANLRVMHSTTLYPAGKGVALDINGDAVWVKGHVVEPTAIKLVEEEVLTSFSVGIANPGVIFDARAKGGRITSGKFVEISLVDRPANPSCKYQIVKRKGDDYELTEKFAGSKASMLLKLAQTAIDQSEGQDDMLPVVTKADTPVIPESDLTAETDPIMALVDQKTGEPVVVKEGPQVSDPANPANQPQGQPQSSAGAPQAPTPPPAHVEPPSESGDSIPAPYQAGAGAHDHNSDGSHSHDGSKPDGAHSHENGADGSHSHNGGPEGAAHNHSDAGGHGYHVHQTEGQEAATGEEAPEGQEASGAAASGAQGAATAAAGEATKAETTVETSDEAEKADVAVTLAKGLSEAVKAGQRAVKVAPWGLRKMHDVLCGAYSLDALKQAYPTIVNKDADVSVYQDAMEALRNVILAEVEADPGDGTSILCLRQLADIYEELGYGLLYHDQTQSDGDEPDLDDILLFSVHAQMHKAFEEANPDAPSVSPMDFNPGAYTRGFLSEGHFREIAGAQNNTSDVSDNHGDTPSPNSVSRATNPNGVKLNKDTSGSSGRVYYSNNQRAQAAGVMQSLHDHIATVFPEICATTPGAGSPGSGEQIEFVSRSELAPEEGLDTDGEGPKETKVEKAVTTPDKTGIINPEIAAMQEQIASLTALVTKMASEPDPNQAKPKGTAGLVVAEKVAHRTPDEVQQDVRSRETFEEQMQRRAMEQMALYSSDPSIREAALKALREVQKTG